MSNVTPFPSQSAQGAKGPVGQTGFDRLELQRIMDLYGRMVAAGHWRDYAIDLGREAAIFSAFRRSAERPEFRIDKRSEEPTSELQSLMRISYAPFCLTKQNYTL